MRPQHWLFFGAAGICASHLSACSSKFDACSESRTCAPTNEAGAVGSEAGSATSETGAAGSPENSGGDGGDGGAAGGSTGNAGASGESEAGAGGEAGATLIACDAPLSACGKACVDLKADPKNCGRCGHDCLGGACDQGSCQPLTIVPPDAYIYDVLVATPYVYWSGCNAQFTECHVKRRRTDASDDVTTIGPSEGNLYGLAASATNLYWLSNGHVRVCPLPGCGTGPTDLVAVPNGFVQGGRVLFSQPGLTLFWSAPTSIGNDGLGAFKLQTATPVTVGTATGHPVALASDDQNVYWLDESTYTSTNTTSTPNPDGTLWRASFSDLVPKPLATGSMGFGGSLAVGPEAIYFAGKFDSKGPSGVSGAIFRAPLPNGLGAAALPKFAEASAANSLMVDGSMLYWQDSAVGSIERCALSTSCASPEVISVVPNDTMLVRQDATSLYLTSVSGDSLSIQRLAK